MPATRPRHDDPDARETSITYRCVDPLNYTPTVGCEPFQSSAHVRGNTIRQEGSFPVHPVACPTCGSTTVLPWPHRGEDAP